MVVIDRVKEDFYQRIRTEVSWAAGRWVQTRTTQRLCSPIGEDARTLLIGEHQLERVRLPAARVAAGLP